MKHEVFWKNPGYHSRPELQEDIECDYLIVGGGITGVSSAFFLAKEGVKNIVLVEKDYIGSGATGKAAGTLVTRGEWDLVDLIESHGVEKVKIFWQQTRGVLEGIKKVITEEQIDCDAESQDTLMCGFKGENWSNLHAEYESTQIVGDTTDFLEGEALRKEVNSKLFTHGILSMDHGLSVNPLKFVQGFSKAVEKYGVKIYEHTAVSRVKNNIAATTNGKIRFKKLIWAIDVDYPEAKILNLKTTIIVTRPLTHEEVTRIGFSERKKIVWDTRKNENYFTVTKDNRIIVGFGNILVHKRHRKTEPHFPHLRQLQNFVKKVFPYLDLEIDYAWSGHFGVHKHNSQGLFVKPFIKFKENETIISGAGSQIMCFMSAQHIANTLLGKKSPFEGMFAD